MSQSYRDVNERTQFNPTSDESAATAASVKRAELHLLGAFEDLVIASMQVKRLRGLDLTVQIAALAKIDRMKAGVRAGASA